MKNGGVDMLFCRRCGTELAEDGTCPNCAYIDESAYEKNNAVDEEKVSVIDKAKGFIKDAIYSDDEDINFKEAFDKVMDTNENTFEFEENDIEQNKVFAILAYLGILVLVPLLAAKQSKFAQYHVKQGINLLIWSIGYSIVVSILTTLFGILLPDILVSAVNIVFSLVGLVFLALMVIGIINVVNKKAKALPVIKMLLK